MSEIEGSYTPALLSGIQDEPLRSEQRIHEFFPRVLSRIDLLVIFIAIVLFIPNASVVQATQGAGIATYLYWIIGAATFLLPGALVAAQLYRFMPVDGSIYVWTHRALGPLFGFLAGFCAWFPGVLVLLAASDGVLTLIQGIGAQLAGTNANWLADPWQQGLVVIAVLLVAAAASTLPLTSIMKVARVIIALYAVGILIVGMAAFVWLLKGHAPATSLTTSKLGLSGQNIVLYGVIVLALLGIEVPLNMAGEEKERGASYLFLRWGPVLVLVAYLLGTFGVMTVVPQAISSTNYSTLTAAQIVFGTPIAVTIGLIFISFFIIVTVIYNITFARILFVSALDHRLPPSLARVNRHHAPYLATNIQSLIVILLAIFTYFVGPLLYNVDANSFSLEVYNVSQATTTVIWCISMIILFLDLPILLYRFRAFLAQKREHLLASPWVLSLACLIGGIASLLGISTTVTASWIPNLIPNNTWTLIIALLALICLLTGLLGSAYPRLLASLNEQTEAARENAHLYHDLSIAYAKLSEIDQLKDAFLTTASHELRTPLTIVQGYLELLGEMENADAEMRRQFITKARRACDELVLLQANIMDASRIKFDTANMIYGSIPLRDVITSVIDLFEPLTLQQGRTIEVSVLSEIKVWADETRLKQVIRNLVANALRYSPDNTPVRITASIEPGRHMARVNVIDLGAGIPPDKQEAIFEKFVRLERDMHGITRGSGLGLYITRQLVEAMRGKITVQSSGVSGEGSTFSFTLPLKQYSTKPL